MNGTRQHPEFERAAAAVHEAGRVVAAAQREVRRLEERSVWAHQYRTHEVGAVTAELNAARAALATAEEAKATADLALAAAPRGLIVAADGGQRRGSRPDRVRGLV